MVSTGYSYEKRFPPLLSVEDEKLISFPFPPEDHHLSRTDNKSPRCDSIVQIIHLFPQLTVIGLHGDSTANALKVVGEDHNIERESAITQHPPVVANIVLGHLSNQTRAIPKVALVSIYLHFLLFIPFEKALTININDHAAE